MERSINKKARDEGEGSHGRGCCEGAANRLAWAIAEAQQAHKRTARGTIGTLQARLLRHHPDYQSLRSCASNLSRACLYRGVFHAILPVILHACNATLRHRAQPLRFVSTRSWGSMKSRWSLWCDFRQLDCFRSDV